ncbi:MAG: bifunctional 3,4-dihydroxy-2-butanone-4-phosphate synthase/GTP cyclohydrolase II [Chloroflexi bacterium]|nr:bifunctional 3,4-dihydroxy-2-butanone-4-phosphate synthase/GTP cyclohydrolase II [Chloroflexota bacterium]
MSESSSFTSVEAAIDAYRNGQMVILVDDEDRENEGDFAMAADAVTPEAINFMATVGRGLICVSMEGGRLDELDLPMMVQRNTARLATAFTISVDATDGITTGISAFDRAQTIRVMIDEKSTPDDLARPGHIFPLRYAKGGVLVRAGQTEGSVDLAKLAGRFPAGIICEIMGPDGDMARMAELEKISDRYGIPIVTVADIIKYRYHHGNLIERVAEARIPTEHGVFQAFAYRSVVDSAEHVAMVMGDIDPDSPTLVRVHSECLTGDVFGSLRCDCGDQAERALKLIGESGNGVFLYMRQEGRGIGLVNKLKAYQLQDEGLDTVEANEKLGFQMDARHYGVGAQILAHIGVGKFKLLTNNPRKMVGLRGYGLKVVEQLPLEIEPNAENIKYLKTKKMRMGHLLEFPDMASEVSDS